MDYVLSSGVTLPSERDALLAQETSRKLAAHFRVDQEIKIQLQEKEGESIMLELPAVAARLLLDVLEHIARGNAVTLMPIHAELTTQQAADLLNVSRPHLIELLDNNKIPFRKVGTHRRVRVEDVLAYKQKIDTERRQVLDQLAAYDQELGLE